MCVGKHVEIENIVYSTTRVPSSSRYEMALTSLETYYSFPNIDVTNNHLNISLDDGKTWMDTRIPTGSYEIKAINNELKRSIMEKTGDKEKEKRIILSPNRNTLRCVFVEFNADDNLCKVLGFNKKIYKAGRHESENLVNILSVNLILVHCDIIEASRLNGIEALVIYNFFPDVAPGDKIVSTPLHLIYNQLTFNIA